MIRKGRRRLMRRRGTVLIALLAFVAGAGLAGEGGDGGTGGGTGGNGASGDSASDSVLVVVPASPDTFPIGAARRAGTRFNPYYGSVYNINRNTSNWEQSFNFGSWAGPVDLSSTTTIGIGKDTSLDRRSHNNRTGFTFAYSPARDFRLNSALNITRSSIVDAGRTSSGQDSETFGFDGNYRKLLPFGVFGNFTVEAGTSRDKRTDPLTSNRLSTGPRGGGSAVFTAQRWANWTVRTRLNRSRFTSTELETNESTSDHNRLGDLGITASFKLPGFQNIQVTSGRMRNQVQYPLLETEIIDLGGGELDTVQVVNQETNLNVTEDLSVTTVSAPIPRMTLNAGINYRSNDIDRVIDLQQSQQAIDHGANARMTYQFTDSTRVEMRGDWGVGRNLYDDPRRSRLNGDAVTRSVGGIVRRPLGRRATFDVSTNYQLQQFFFDIRDTGEETDDRDIVRGDLNARVDYFPGKRVKTNVRFSFQHNQTIFLEAAKSSFNQTQQLYSIYPSLEYIITPLVTLREDASIIANATVSEFNVNANRLSRTSELRTSIEAKVHRRLFFALRYGLRFLQDGSYKEEDDGIRRFAKSNEDSSHDVYFNVNYTPIPGGAVFFNSHMRNSDLISVQVRGNNFVEIPAATEFDEIEIGAQIDHTLKMGLKVGGNVRRLQNWTSSGSRNNYWVGSVSVGQQF
jgi:hypothetical protein